MWQKLNEIKVINTFNPGILRDRGNIILCNLIIRQYFSK